MFILNTFFSYLLQYVLFVNVIGIRIFSIRDSTHQKNKITKIPHSEKNSERNVRNQRANSKIKRINRMEIICNIPDLEQEFYHVDNGGKNMVLKLPNPLTCITVA